MHRVEFAGMLLLAAIPVAAMLGLFGPSSTQASTESGAVSLQVTYPTVMRYRTRATIEARVENRTDRKLDRVQVSLAPRYLAGFDKILVSPAAADVAFSVTLAGLAPGEARLVVVDVEASGYGRKRGEIRASADGADAVLPLTTLILP